MNASDRESNYRGWNPLRSTRLRLLFLLLVILCLSQMWFRLRTSPPSKSYVQTLMGGFKPALFPKPKLHNLTHRYLNSSVKSPLRYNLTDFKNSLNEAGPDFWQNIKPAFTCPSHLLTRVGSDLIKEDGKWACGLQNLGRLSQNVSPPCVVYSFGVANSCQFEQEVLSTTHCLVYSFDHTVDKIGNPLRTSNPRANFQKIGIGGQDTEQVKTLKSIMEQNGHEWIDILKVDVEAAEYEALNRTLEDFPDSLPFGQLLMEIHVFHGWKGYLSKTTDLVEFLKKLERRGLRMFKNEVNPHGVTCCAEVSLINTRTAVQPPWQ